MKNVCNCSFNDILCKKTLDGMKQFCRSPLFPPFINAISIGMDMGIGMGMGMGKLADYLSYMLQHLTFSERWQRIN